MKGPVRVPQAAAGAGSERHCQRHNGARMSDHRGKPRCGDENGHQGVKAHGGRSERQRYHGDRRRRCRVSRGSRLIICGRNTTGEPARFDAARARRAGDSQRHRGRRYADDSDAAATLWHRTRTLSLHAHNEAQRIESIAALLGGGNSVALVSDAGTPAISDPGARLVRAMRDAGFPVIPIPGPSAVIAAVSAAGLDADAFLFAGFLPQQGKARRERLQALGSVAAALVFYEAPHRVRATVDDLLASLDGDRMLIVARELTKTFETIARMPLAEAPAWIAADANRSAANSC
jgi:precorrin-6B methylase 1